MGGLVFVIIVGIVVWAMIFNARKLSKPIRDYDRVSTSGLPARGLILVSERTPTPRTFNGRRFESRSVTMDVEIEGREPYTLVAQLMIPRGLLSALPGDSVDLRVDPSDPSIVAVIGPGGFSGPWLRQAGSTFAMPIANWR